MQGSPVRFSRGFIASPEWYARLGELCAGSFTPAAMLALIDELVERLEVDSVLVLRYPKDASPQLLYGRANQIHRSNTVEDYLRGHYALDPFYLRSAYCIERGLASLREVIEEDLASSDYYKVHYRSAGLIDEMCFCSEDGMRGSLNLSLSRTVERNRFTVSELHAARAVAPLVNAALGATWRALSPEISVGAQAAPGDHHRHIENVRLNFGRSVLTHREFEILQDLLHGKSVGLIARRLGIAVSTVKVHRKHIYSKLNINSQAGIFTLFMDVVAGTKYKPGQDPLRTYQRPQTP